MIHWEVHKYYIIINIIVSQLMVPLRSAERSVGAAYTKRESSTSLVVFPLLNFWISPYHLYMGSVLQVLLFAARQSVWCNLGLLWYGSGVFPLPRWLPKQCMPGYPLFASFSMPSPLPTALLFPVGSGQVLFHKSLLSWKIWGYWGSHRSSEIWTCTEMWLLFPNRLWR